MIFEFKVYLDEDDEFLGRVLKVEKVEASSPEEALDFFKEFLELCVGNEEE